jgi:hypothetical protein
MKLAMQLAALVLLPSIASFAASVILIALAAMFGPGALLGVVALSCGAWLIQRRWLRRYPL